MPHYKNADAEKSKLWQKQRVQQKKQQHKDFIKEGKRRKKMNGNDNQNSRERMFNTWMDKSSGVPKSQIIDVFGKDYYDKHK